MKRLIAGVVVAAVLVGGTSAIAAGGTERTVAPGSQSAKSSPIDKRMGELRRGLALASRAKVHCQTLRCVNSSLTKLARAANAFGTVFSCMEKVQISRYDNYVITDGQGNLFPTTGLDYSEPGDTGTTFLTFVC